MDSSRRRVLQILGLTGAALTARPVLNAFAADTQPGAAAKPVLKAGDKALEAKQWAMVIDSHKFHSEEDVEPLMEACHSIHNVPHLENHNHEIKWIWPEHYHNAIPGKAARFLMKNSICREKIGKLLAQMMRRLIGFWMEM